MDWLSENIGKRHALALFCATTPVPANAISKTSQNELKEKLKLRTEKLTPDDRFLLTSTLAHCNTNLDHAAIIKQRFDPSVFHRDALTPHQSRHNVLV